MRPNNITYRFFTDLALSVEREILLAYAQQCDHSAPYIHVWALSGGSRIDRHDACFKLASVPGPTAASARKVLGRQYPDRHWSQTERSSDEAAAIRCGSTGACHPRRVFDSAMAWLAEDVATLPSSGLDPVRMDHVARIAAGVLGMMRQYERDLEAAQAARSRENERVRAELGE